jgi:hypothetical protein
MVGYVHVQIAPFLISFVPPKKTIHTNSYLNEVGVKTMTGTSFEAMRGCEFTCHVILFLGLSSLTSFSLQSSVDLFSHNFLPVFEQTKEWVLTSLA